MVFLKQAGFSHINPAVAATLGEAFPEFRLVILDVFEDVLRLHPATWAGNLPALLRMHGRSIVARQRTVRGAFLMTPWMLAHLRRLLVREVASCGTVAFTFQTQSLFDAATPLAPHFVYTDHAHLANLCYPAFSRQRLLSRAWIDAEGDIYRHATKTFVMSRHVQRTLVERYFCDPERVACIYAGSNLRPPPEGARPAWGTRRIVFVGVDWERKGGPVLLAAFRRVRKTFPDAQLDVVGCRPAIDEPGVHLSGRIPLAQVSGHLLHSSVFCLPTRIEPFGIAPLEAMAHRLPVVGTRVGALPDFVEDNHNGLLVEPDDTQALATALGRLLADPEMCRRFGTNGFRRYQERYTWPAVGRRLRTEILPLLPRRFTA